MKNAVALLHGEGERSESTVLLMRTDSFQRMIKYFTLNFGTAGLTMIYSMGETNGKYETNLLREELKSLDAPITKTHLIEKSLWRLTSMGWGSFKLNTLNPLTGEATINISVNPFDSQCQSTEAGGCYFIQGYIAGIIEEALHEEITYCDPRCTKTEDGTCQLSLKNVKESDPPQSRQ